MSYNSLLSKDSDLVKNFINYVSSIQEQNPIIPTKLYESISCVTNTIPQEKSKKNGLSKPIFLSFLIIAVISIMIITIAIVSYLVTNSSIKSINSVINSKSIIIVDEIVIRDLKSDIFKVQIFNFVNNGIIIPFSLIILVLVTIHLTIDKYSKKSENFDNSDSYESIISENNYLYTLTNGQFQKLNEICKNTEIINDEITISIDKSIMDKYFNKNENGICTIKAYFKTKTFEIIENKDLSFVVLNDRKEIIYFN